MSREIIFNHSLPHTGSTFMLNLLESHSDISAPAVSIGREITFKPNRSKLYTGTSLNIGYCQDILQELLGFKPPIYKYLLIDDNFNCPRHAKLYHILPINHINFITSIRHPLRVIRTFRTRLDAPDWNGIKTLHYFLIYLNVIESVPYKAVLAVDLLLEMEPNKRLNYLSSKFKSLDIELDTYIKKAIIEWGTYGTKTKKKLVTLDDKDELISSMEQMNLLQKLRKYGYTENDLRKI